MKTERLVQIERLRLATMLTIEKLLDTGRFTSARLAFVYILVKARQKRIATGFDHHGSAEKAWGAFRTWKSRRKDSSRQALEGHYHPSRGKK